MAKVGRWSVRAAMVARWFGVGRGAVESARKVMMGAPWPRVQLRGGCVVLLTGASGAGKSTFLRRLRRRSGRGVGWVDLAAIDDAAFARGLVIDVMAEAMGGGEDEASVVAALEALSRVGLGEVWTYLRRPAELSEGQRWRLRLAVALARAGGVSGEGVGQARPPKGGGRGKLCVLAADEFAAPLDRVTAMVVARALRKAISARADLCAVVATSHDDLLGALAPDVVVRCDFGACASEEGGRHGQD